MTTNSMRTGLNRVILLLIITGIAGACDRRSASPITTAPSAIAQPASPPPALVPPLPLSGYIVDTAFRAVAGVNVEVLDGPRAGSVTTSDAAGAFSYEGTFESLVRVRATKDGYATRELTSWTTTNGRMYAYFQLGSIVPPVSAVAGSYMLTLSADAACTALPEDVRTRTYPVSVVATSNNGRFPAPADTAFEGIVTGGQFAPYANMLWIGVFGDYVAISTAGDGPTLVEQVGPNRYVAFYDEASMSVGPDGTSAFSAPFRGSIEYCELTSARGQYYDCSPARASVREECLSDGSQLTLTRR